MVLKIVVAPVPPINITAVEVKNIAKAVFTLVFPIKLGYRARFYPLGKKR